MALPMLALGIYLFSNITSNIYKRFKYYGRGYISFGDPVTINDFLDQNAPTWKQDSLGITANSKPSWLFDTVNQLSDQITER